MGMADKTPDLLQNVVIFSPFPTFLQPLIITIAPRLQGLAIFM